MNCTKTEGTKAQLNPSNSMVAAIVNTSMPNSALRLSESGKETNPIVNCVMAVAA